MCQKLCHENCSFCSVKIDKTLLCGHTKNSVPCGFDEEQIKCMSPCERILMCNHKCQAMCYEKCPPCNEQVIYLYINTIKNYLTLLIYSFRLKKLHQIVGILL